MNETQLLRTQRLDAKRECDGHDPSQGLKIDWPVIILNTHHSGLAIARDLAPLGVRVIGLTAIASFPGNSSRLLEYRAAPDSLTDGRCTSRLSPEARR